MLEDLSTAVRAAARRAGRAAERARHAHRAGRSEGFDLPRDEAGRARVVCRRHAERRAVELDARGRPDCYDGDHSACRGCAEDVRSGRIETW
jgi:hypothetical protein